MKLTRGTFTKAVHRANELVADDNVVLLIDEISRASISRVFGEILQLLEYRGKSMPGVYESITVPENLIFLCTSNESDRSVEGMDRAFVERFWWIEPDKGSHQRVLLERWLRKNFIDQTTNIKTIVEAYKCLNDTLKSAEPNSGVMLVGAGRLMRKNVSTDQTGDHKFCTYVEWLIDHVKYSLTRVLREQARTADVDRQIIDEAIAEFTKSLNSIEQSRVGNISKFDNSLIKKENVT